MACVDAYADRDFFVYPIEDISEMFKAIAHACALPSCCFHEQARRALFDNVLQVLQAGADSVQALFFCARHTGPRMKIEKSDAQLLTADQFVFKSLSAFFERFAIRRAEIDQITVMAHDFL